MLKIQINIHAFFNGDRKIDYIQINSDNLFGLDFHKNIFTITKKMSHGCGELCKMLPKRNEVNHTSHRLEMFCDGVYSIIITLLILDIKVPSVEQVDSIAGVWYGLGQRWPSFLAFFLGFTTIFISWMSHHNFLATIDKTSPQFILANGYFLFTLVLVPFSTAFVAEYLDSPYLQPAILFYCFNRILNVTGWLLLLRTAGKPYSLFKNVKPPEIQKQAQKGLKLGLVVYASMALLAWWLPFVALGLSILVSGYWLYLGGFLPRAHN